MPVGPTPIRGPGPLPPASPPGGALMVTGRGADARDRRTGLRAPTLVEWVGSLEEAERVRSSEDQVQVGSPH